MLHGVGQGIKFPHQAYCEARITFKLMFNFFWHIKDILHEVSKPSGLITPKVNFSFSVFTRDLVQRHILIVIYQVANISYDNLRFVEVISYFGFGS